MGIPGESFTRSYPANAESVPRVRSDLTRFATEAGAGGERLDAIRLAASEAVTNGVLHAYNGTPGTIQVSASRVGDEFWLLVADDGSGLRPRGPHSGLGLGLAMIAQLADDFQILSRSTGGTELRMQFSLARRDAERPRPVERRQLRGSLSSAAIPA
jgi:anti-sigma regulatory factor (Ser/Thr protein kinase)